MRLDYFIVDLSAMSRIVWGPDGAEDRYDELQVHTMEGTRTTNCAQGKEPKVRKHTPKKAG